MIHRFIAVLLLAAPAAAQFDVPEIPAAKTARRAPQAGTADCKDIAVDAKTAVTEGTWLESRLYSETHYGNYGEGRYGRGQQQETGETHRERVQLIFNGERNLRPWETETFTACLEGTVTNVWARKTGYKYDIVEDSREPGNFYLTPTQRLQLDPDAKGVTAELVNGPAGITLRFTDKWAAEYAGDSLAVRAELWQKKDGWFDSKVAELSGEFQSPTQGSLGFAGFTQAGGEYYAKWSFRRVGKISKGTEIRGEKTAAVRFVP
ncbi:MAG: hypothetical protein HY925_11445 [Elusimicrobia bacterium]|nr:hypothetical protein [Elusimicrobiota bacterium]